MSNKQTIRRLATAAPLICGTLAFLGGHAASAAEPAWPHMTYDYVVVDQDLRAVLQQFGSNVGLRVVVSEAVQGRVRGRLPPLPPRQFLDHLSQAYGLDWFFDGAVLAVSASSETETRFLALQGLDARGLEDGLRAADLLEPRFAVRPGPGPETAMVSGPPRYVKLVQEAAGALAGRPAAAQAPAGSVIVTVFRGASAAKVQLP